MVMKSAEILRLTPFAFDYFYNYRGDRLGGTNRWGNRFLFTGREWLQDLKVYDCRNRIYQPELGRFLQPDPMEFEAGDYNLYRYCHNDPVNRSDPMGLFPGLTNEGGGDWIKGSDGLSAWDRDHGMPSNPPGGGIKMAPVFQTGPKNTKQTTEGPTSRIVRNAYQSFTDRGKRTGNRITIIRFKYTVIVNGKPVGQGVRLDENVSFKDGVDVAPQGPNKSWTTNDHGQAFDDYAIPFYSERGSVRIVQPLTVGGKLGGQWETIVRANGSYNMSSEAKTEQEGDTMLLRPK
jgi:RHS repeat-associated protein